MLAYHMLHGNWELEELGLRHRKLTLWRASHVSRFWIVTPNTSSSHLLHKTITFLSLFHCPTHTHWLHFQAHTLAPPLSELKNRGGGSSRPYTTLFHFLFFTLLPSLTLIHFHHTSLTLSLMVINIHMSSQFCTSTHSSLWLLLLTHCHNSLFSPLHHLYS